MITMVDKNSILIWYFREEKTISQIARELKTTRKTVRKYLREHEEQIKSKKIAEHLEKGVSYKPIYDISGRKKKRLTPEMIAVIKDCLKKNQEKYNQGLHKQIMKKIDIHEYLEEKGYQIGYTTVCNFIRKEASSAGESFIKQIYKPGETCEFDWGEVKLKINGKWQKLNLAVFTSAYSNYRWAKLFNRQDSLAFSQSHIDFFLHVSYVYKEMVYDNMRVAVAKFVGRTQKTPTQALLELSSYYKFAFRFCNVRKGNEKGHVERSVEYVRRKSFSLLDEFISLEKANIHLSQKCENLNKRGQKLAKNKTAIELFELEKSNLFQTNIPYKCFKEEHAKVDKYSTIILFQNRYSVPDFLVGKLLNLRVFAEKIDLYFNEEQVCSHIRSYGNQVWTLDVNHYLNTLKRKPGALKNALVFQQLSGEVKEVYHKYFNGKSRDFVELLLHCKEKTISFSEVQTAINKLNNMSIRHITKDQILAVISKEREIPIQEEKQDETLKFAQSSLKKLSKMLELN